MNLPVDPRCKPPPTPQNIRHIRHALAIPQNTPSLRASQQNQSHVRWASRLQSLVESPRSRGKTRPCGRASAAGSSPGALPLRRLPRARGPCWLYLQRPSSTKMAGASARARALCCVPPESPCVTAIQFRPSASRWASAALTTQGKPPALWLLCIAHYERLVSPLAVGYRLLLTSFQRREIPNLHFLFSHIL